MKTSNVSILVVVVALVSVIATLYFSPDKSLPSADPATQPVAKLPIPPLAEDTRKPKKSDTPTVKFEVVGGKLEITDPDCGGNKKGCFKVSKKKSGEIKYIFASPDKTWQLTEFKICKGEDADKDNGGLDCNLTLWERLEFFVSEGSPWTEIYDTDSNGSIDLTVLAPGPAVFYLLDQNSIKNNYFYSIKACKTNDSTVCITTDPEIDNRGRNSG